MRMNKTTSRMGWGPLAALVAGLSLMGCGGASTPEPEPQQRVSDGHPANAPVTAQRGAIIGGEPIARVIEWPRVENVDHDIRSAFTNQELAVVDGAPVPALAPANSAWLDEVTVTSGEHFFALSAKLRGQTLYIQGSDQARVYPSIRGGTPTEPLRSTLGYVSQNEGIWTADFLENGAAYTVELECADVEMVECQSDVAIRDIADALVLVGGAGIEVVQ